MDLFELNEAFAAQSCAVAGDLGLDPAKVHQTVLKILKTLNKLLSVQGHRAADLVRIALFCFITLSHSQALCSIILLQL